MWEEGQEEQTPHVKYNLKEENHVCIENRKS